MPAALDRHVPKGKFVVLHKRERAGRLFDFYEGKAKKYTSDFGQGAGGEVATDKLSEIDKLLAGIFTKRVTENETPAKRQPVAKTA